MLRLSGAMILICPSSYILSTNNWNTLMSHHRQAVIVNAHFIQDLIQQRLFTNLNFNFQLNLTTKYKQ